MKNAILIGAAAFVLMTLTSAVPQMQESNIADHMQFTRDSSSQEARIGGLEESVAEMRIIPERMARIEERLDLMGKLLFGLLTGIFGLLFKELWGMARALSRKIASP